MKTIDAIALGIALLLATGLPAPNGYPITGNITGIICCFAFLGIRKIRRHVNEIRN